MILEAYYEGLGSKPQFFSILWGVWGAQPPGKTFAILGVFPLIFYQKDTEEKIFFKYHTSIFQHKSGYPVTFSKTKNRGGGVLFYTLGNTKSILPR